MDTDGDKVTNVDVTIEKMFSNFLFSLVLHVSYDTNVLPRH